MQARRHITATISILYNPENKTTFSIQGNSGPVAIQKCLTIVTLYPAGTLRYIDVVFMLWGNVNITFEFVRMSSFIEPTCANARWALMRRFLSVRLLF